MSIEQSVIKKIQSLTPEQQREVTDFVESLLVPIRTTAAFL